MPVFTQQSPIILNSNLGSVAGDSNHLWAAMVAPTLPKVDTSTLKNEMAVIIDGM